jgi:hypothetical protein
MSTSDDLGLPQQPAPTPATRISRPVTTGDTVTVACKLPHGVILRVFDWEEFDEPMRDGTIRRGRRGKLIPDLQFTVRGTWLGSAGQAYNERNGAVAELLPGGYALTTGCPKEIWDRWHDQNEMSLLVQNKIIFAHATHSTVSIESAKLRAVTSGLEPLDRGKPAERMPGGVDRRVKIGELEKDDGTAPR